MELTVPAGAKSLAEYSVTLLARFWPGSEDQFRIAYDMRKTAKDRLHAAGIAIPAPRQAAAERPEGGGANPSATLEPAPPQPRQRQDIA